jgi:hypothetical protein
MYGSHDKVLTAKVVCGFHDNLLILIIDKILIATNPKFKTINELK